MFELGFLPFFFLLELVNFQLREGNACQAWGKRGDPAVPRAACRSSTLYQLRCGSRNCFCFSFPQSPHGG